MRVRGAELVGLALILALYAALFARTTGDELVWDDLPEIAQSPAFDRPLVDGLRLTQVERAVPELAPLGTLQFGYDSYRPLLFASYWIDLRLWGRDPGALHRTSAILGALAVLLAYALARRWLGSPWALVPTALFALHPVQVETVAYVSARGDLLAGLFALAAGYAVLRATDGDRRRTAIAWTAAACALFAAAMLGKESAIGLPLAVAALAAARARRRWWIAAALLAVALLYLGARAALLPTTTAPPYAAALARAPGALLAYARIFALPLDCSIERRLGDGYAAAGWTVAAAFVCVGATAAWRTRGTPRPAWVSHALTGAAWAIAMLAPSLVAVRVNGVVADRYAYTAMVGAGVALAAALSALAAARPRLARIVGAALALWAAGMYAVAWRQVDTWESPETLYAHAVALAPDSSSAHYRVAVLDIAAARWDLAVPELEAAIALDPDNALALNNLGVYQLRTSPALAETTLRRAVTAEPAHYRAWLNLGLAQLAEGQRAPGCASIDRALAIDPAYAAARSARAQRCGTP